MKQKAFTITELLAVVVLLGVILMIAVPSYSKYVENTRREVYKSYEKAMEDAASSYVTECIYKNRCADGDPMKNEVEVTLKKLMDWNYLEEISIKNAECDGEGSKVSISHDNNNDSYTYKVTLKCREYSNVD